MAEKKEKNSNIKKFADKRKELIGYGPVSAVLVTLGIYFGTQIAAGLLFGIYALQRNIDEELIVAFFEKSVIAQFIFILFIEVLSVYFLWVFLGSRKLKWSDIGLKKPSLNNLLFAVPGYVIYFVILLVVVGLVKAFVPGVDTGQEQQIGFETAASGFDLSLVFISLVLMPAVVEEILVRGFLYGGLVKKFSKFFAALLASAIFAIAHLQFGSGQPLLWIAAIDTFILSMVLIALRERTGNIWAGVAVHMVKNGLAFISLFILKLG